MGWLVFSLLLRLKMWYLSTCTRYSMRQLMGSLARVKSMNKRKQYFRPSRSDFIIFQPQKKQPQIFKYASRTYSCLQQPSLSRSTILDTLAKWCCILQNFSIINSWVRLYLFQFWDMWEINQIKMKEYKINFV